MIFHNVIELPLTDIFLFWIKLKFLSLITLINYLGSGNRAWTACATARRVFLHYPPKWKEYFLGDQTFLFRISVVLWLPQTDYEITYSSYSGTSLVMLKSYFYYYLHLLTKLLTTNSSCPPQMQRNSWAVVEYKEPSSIDYIYYSIGFSLHFSLH